MERHNKHSALLGCSFDHSLRRLIHINEYVIKTRTVKSCNDLNKKCISRKRSDTVGPTPSQNVHAVSAYFLYPVYTIQPVVKPLAECLFTRCNQLSNRLYNRLSNRLYRVNGVLRARVFSALFNTGK